MPRITSDIGEKQIVGKIIKWAMQLPQIGVQ
jgi:hypothetical protein